MPEYKPKPITPPLAAKHYEEIFPMVCCTSDYVPGQLMRSSDLADFYCVRECFIAEFAHIEAMRKTYTQAALAFAPGTVIRYYEVSCRRDKEQVLIERPEKPTN